MQDPLANGQGILGVQDHKGPGCHPKGRGAATPPRFPEDENAAQEAMIYEHLI